MKRGLVLILLIFLAKLLFAQEQYNIPVYFPFTTKERRQQLHKQMIDTVIHQNLSHPLNDSTEGGWNEAFWAMELLVYRNDYSKQKITKAWQKANTLSEDFQKNLLEVSFSIYPDEFKQEVAKLLQATRSVPVFIRSAEYLLQAEPSPTISSTIRLLVKKNFNGVQDIGLTILENRLAKFHQLDLLPPLKDIFNKSFLRGQTVIYSLQRKNRNYPGVVIIRRPDGRFLKNKDSSVFSVSQLARAITNFPFYITNGNTPQGIFRWTSFDISKNSLIGPTPNLQLVLPYEANPFVFFADSTLVNADWKEEMYESMLPESWKNYDAIYESFYAGATGRNEIIMHGTTIDPAFYTGQLYYPQTPSLGCLCSYEEWDRNGMRTTSNQQKIDDALDSFDSGNGYVVVLELNNERKPVNINEVSNIIKFLEDSSPTK